MDLNIGLRFELGVNCGVATGPCAGHAAQGYKAGVRDADTSIPGFDTRFHRYVRVNRA
jgi:hypothetical protein